MRLVLLIETALLLTAGCNESGGVAPGDAASETASVDSRTVDAATIFDATAADDASGGGAPEGGAADSRTDAGADRGTAPSRLLGGFGAYSTAAMKAVQSVGLGSVMDYISITKGLDSAHASLSTYTKQAASLGLKMIDDVPQQLIDRYHKDWNMKTLVADMTTHLTWLVANPAVKDHIVAYWIIDDWYSDFGAAKTALQNITALIHKHTPGVPAICGHTGNTSYGNTASGYAKFAANFSPQGCDMVGVYLYPWGAGKVPMTNLVNIKAGLKNNGWDIKVTPLVGIAQSYGAANGYDIPTAAQIESQTKYFCDQGATHILYYDFHTGTSAATSSTIQAGIKAGLAACKKIWGQ